MRSDSDARLRHLRKGALRGYAIRATRVYGMCCIDFATKKEVPSRLGTSSQSAGTKKQDVAISWCIAFSFRHLPVLGHLVHSPQKAPDTLRAFWQCHHEPLFRDKPYGYTY